MLDLISMLMGFVFLVGAMAMGAMGFVSLIACAFGIGANVIKGCDHE